MGDCQSTQSSITTKQEIAYDLSPEGDHKRSKRMSIDECIATYSMKPKFITTLTTNFNTTRLGDDDISFADKNIGNLKEDNISSMHFSQYTPTESNKLSLESLEVVSGSQPILFKPLTRLPNRPGKLPVVGKLHNTASNNHICKSRDVIFLPVEKSKTRKVLLQVRGRGDDLEGSNTVFKLAIQKTPKAAKCRTIAQ